MSHNRIELDKIAALTGGKLIINNSSKTVVSQLLTDSRKVVNPEVSLFFAIKGLQHNGHEFIAELQHAGVCNFVISEQSAISSNSKANFILIEDPLSAMQQLAKWHRQQFKIPVVGITGSNGKTIIKEWLYQLMREDHHIVRSPKSYNSQIGVPLSVWQISDEDNFGIFEAGISQPDRRAHV